MQERDDQRRQQPGLCFRVWFGLPLDQRKHARDPVSILGNLGKVEPQRRRRRDQRGRGLGVRLFRQAHIKRKADVVQVVDVPVAPCLGREVRQVRRRSRHQVEHEHRVASQQLRAVVALRQERSTIAPRCVEQAIGRNGVVAVEEDKRLVGEGDQGVKCRILVHVAGGNAESGFDIEATAEDR